MTRPWDGREFEVTSSRRATDDERIDAEGRRRRCCCRVYRPGGVFGGSPCAGKASVIVEGTQTVGRRKVPQTWLVCATHSPERDEMRAARSRAYVAEVVARQVIAQRAHEALQALRVNAREAVRLWESGPLYSSPEFSRAMAAMKRNLDTLDHPGEAVDG